MRGRFGQSWMRSPERAKDITIMTLDEARKSFNETVSELEQLLETRESTEDYKAATLFLKMVIAAARGGGPVPTPPTTNTFPCPKCSYQITYY